MCCLCAEPGSYDGPGAVAAAADGKLVGKGFVVDHVIRGESIEEVLSRCNHQVRVSAASEICLLYSSLRGLHRIPLPIFGAGGPVRFGETSCLYLIPQSPGISSQWCAGCGHV